MNTNRDFSSVSPSAKALLLMKGYTTIPFAKEAAALISAPEPYTPDPEQKDFIFWARTSHFESRYLGVNELLQEVAPRQVLELSSGFSFRGLDLTRTEAIHYIDTDLPALIAQKQALVAQLEETLPPAKGKLETCALNALDEGAFKAMMQRFAPGPVTIVNEGLLMYLDREEKQQLCANIHAVLKERGGYWITADVYIRQEAGMPSARLNDELQQFLDRHNVEENKFDSLEAAEAFFGAAGFRMDREAHPDYAAMSTTPYLMKSLPPGQLEQMKKMGKIQATWRLKAI